MKRIIRKQSTVRSRKIVSPRAWLDWGRHGPKIDRRTLYGVLAFVVMPVMVFGLAKAADSIVNSAATKVCSFGMCFVSQKAKGEYECKNGCYFENDPLDVSPKAICETMAESDHEGNIPYMYRDTVGAITVGIGNMLPNVDAALAINFEITINDVTRKATQQEIKNAFGNLPQQPAACNASTGKGCLPASSYANASSLRISDETANELCQGRINNEFEPVLRSRLKDYDTYPSRVQAALLDMIFNMGPNRFSKKKWPTFYRAIERRDWQGAADNSHRTGIQESRNEYVKGLLEQAATEENEAKARLALCPPMGGIIKYLGH